MERTRLAPTLGIVACLFVLVVLAVPYVQGASGRAVGLYYGTGAVNPLVAGLFTMVGLIVFAAGREGRSDPGTAAGAALALGVFALAVSVLWAVTVRVDVIAISELHRWGLVVVSALVPLAAGWYARALGLL